MNNIKLRKMKKNDLNKIMEFYPEKELLKNTGMNGKPRDITRENELKRLSESIKDYSKKKPEQYEVAIEVNGEFAGSIGANKIDYENKSIRLGYWLGKRYREKGIMTIALKKFIKEINSKFKPIRIWAEVYVFNTASSKVLEKCGFKYEGTRKKVKKINGKFYDDKIYARVK